MINHLVELTVNNATAESFYNFMINPNNDKYRQWWPEEHLQFYITKHGNTDHLGDEVFYNEYLGKKRRLAFNALLTTANKPNNIVWQMKKAGIKLPAFLSVDFLDTKDGLYIRHELKVGFSGIGKLIDPFIKLYINKSFLAALEKHCLTEWPKLAYFLNKEKSNAT